jgi:hypothetical protein
MALWTCRCAWTTRSALPTCPQQQTKKTFKPRFKVDHAASSMPETRQPERFAPRATSNRNRGRDHLGILGEINSVHPGEIVGISNQMLGHRKGASTRSIIATYRDLRLIREHSNLLAESQLMGQSEKSGRSTGRSALPSTSDMVLNA